MSCVVLGRALFWRRGVPFGCFCLLRRALLVLKFAILAKVCNANVVLLLLCDVGTTAQQNTGAHVHIHLQRAPLCGPCIQARLCNLYSLLVLISFTPLPRGNLRGAVF